MIRAYAVPAVDKVDRWAPQQTLTSGNRLAG
jgi:hypothetical protein